MSNDGVYITRHSHAAAYLWYAGLGLMETLKVGNGYEFHFDDPETVAADLEREFWDESQVITSAKKLLEAGREIQREIYAVKFGIRG